jgi:hypothetical protein
MKSSLCIATNCGNNIIFLGVGHAINYITKNDRVLKPRIIDVEAFLKGDPKSILQKL